MSISKKTKLSSDNKSSLIEEYSHLRSLGWKNIRMTREERNRTQCRFLEITRILLTEHI